MARVAVIVPTRDRPAFLGDAISSVLTQDYRDFVVVVVDDGSKNAEENLRVLERLRGPVRYVRRESSGGPSAARNTGVAVSDSEFVAFLDDDDLWVPSKLRLQVDRFDRNPRQLRKLGVVYCGHQWVDFVDGHVQARRIPPLDSVKDLIKARYNLIQTVMLRRECVAVAGGFDEEIAFQENLEFLMRVHEHYDFDGVGDVLVLCRTHRGRRTGDDLAAVVLGYQRLLERASACGLDDFVLSDTRYRLARCLLAAGVMEAGRHQLKRAARHAGPLLRFWCAALLGLSHVARTIPPSLRARPRHR